MDERYKTTQNKSRITHKTKKSRVTQDSAQATRKQPGEQTRDDTQLDDQSVRQGTYRRFSLRLSFVFYQPCRTSLMMVGWPSSPQPRMRCPSFVLLFCLCTRNMSFDCSSFVVNKAKKGHLRFLLDSLPVVSFFPVCNCCSFFAGGMVLRIHSV